MHDGIMERIKEDSELAWFFGFSIGDGYSTYGRYGIDTTTSEIVSLLVDNLRKLTPIPLKAEVYGNPNTFHIPDIETLYYGKKKDVHSDHIKIKVDSVEFASRIKRIQDVIIKNIDNFPLNTKCCILGGFFDAEATVSPNGIVEIDLSPENLELANVISRLLSDIGIENRIFQYSLKIRITARGGMKMIGNLKAFKENVDFKITRKKKELMDMITVYSFPVDNRSKERLVCY